jgi:hypothetical protein
VSGRYGGTHPDPERVQRKHRGTAGLGRAVLTANPEQAPGVHRASATERHRNSGIRRS